MTLFDKEMDEHLMSEAEALCVPGQIMPLRDPAELAPSLRFVVVGQAKGAGSKRAFRNPKTDRIIVTDSSGAAGKTWRAEVVGAAQEALAGSSFGPMCPMLAPLAVEFAFFRPRPKGHYGSGRNAGVLKASAPATPTTRPDVLKLARAVEDALTGILWKDDAQIVDERLRKVWGEPERCEIMVRPL